MLKPKKIVKLNALVKALVYHIQLMMKLASYLKPRFKVIAMVQVNVMSYPFLHPAMK